MTEFEYLPAMRDLLLQFPYPTPYDQLLIDHGQITERQLSDRWGAGAALVSTGVSTTTKRRTVTGRETHRRRANFSLIMWRATNDDEFRRDISNTLNQIINWLNEQNALRGRPGQLPELPTFSNTDFRNEVISADGGIRTAQIDGERSEFSIGLHVDFTWMY